MYNSILHFIANDIHEIEKFTADMLRGKAELHDLTKEISDRMMGLGCRITGEILELLDTELRESLIRKKGWHIERRNSPKELLDAMGMIRFARTEYTNKQTGKSVYLLDQILGLESHQRLTLSAKARILEEAVQTSYAKGGRAASPTDHVSKQTVKRLVHGAKLELPIEEQEVKRQIRHLHIVADEDHVPAQFWEKKGDLRKDERGNKINTLMPKLVCLYEDVIDEAGEASKSHRYRLVGKHYSCGLRKGEEGNRQLWEQVRDYIKANYDTECLERVYIAGDGARWIRQGCDVLEKSQFVLDKFHMMKYVNQSTSHLLDHAAEFREEIWRCLNGHHKKELKQVYERILGVTEESKCKAVEQALSYFLNQWDGIRIRAEEGGANWKCCAEGQVSHVLSARMSSRPMGWSELGCDQMSGLRAYVENGGKIIDLLSYEARKKAEEAARAETEEERELRKEAVQKQAGWRYQERLEAEIPGLETNSLKWMRVLLNEGLGA